MRIPIAVATVVAAAACTDPSPQPQPNEVDVVNATRVDPGVAPGALGNESVNYGEGSITPAERGSIYEVDHRSAGELVANYADLLEQRRFEDAYRMWHADAASFSPEEFAQRLDEFATINAAVGRTAASEGAGGQIQEVQLTLSGEKKDGSNYAVTGPVTVQRSNGDQGRWRIVKMVLTANPHAADALIEPRGGQ